jgi:hypothetical protein
MKDRREVLKLGAMAGAAFVIPTIASGQDGHMHGQSTTSKPQQPAQPARQPDKGYDVSSLFVLRIDGLCAIVQLQDEAKKTIGVDIGFTSYRINGGLRVRPHIPTLSLPLDHVLPGSTPPDAVSRTHAFWNLDGWILDFDVEMGTQPVEFKVNEKKPEKMCPKDPEDWSTLGHFPMADEFAVGTKLRADWRNREMTSSLMRLRKGLVEDPGVPIVTPSSKDGLYFVKDAAGMPVGGDKPRFFKGFIHYALANVQIIAITLTQQSGLNPEQRQIRLRTTNRAEVVNMPVGPRLAATEPLRDVAVYYDLLDKPPALHKRGIPHPLSEAEQRRYPDCSDGRTDGCGCCPPLRFCECA